MTGSHRTEPCPVCGRTGYVPGALMALLLFAGSPLLGGLMATLLDWWWLLTVTFTGWILAVIIAIAGTAAASRWDPPHSPEPPR